MKRYRFTLAISPQRALAYYRGDVQHVVATTATGVRVQFPARLLREIIHVGGIYGEFELICDDQHQSSQIRRLS